MDSIFVKSGESKIRNTEKLMFGSWEAFSEVRFDSTISYGSSCCWSDDPNLESKLKVEVRWETNLGFDLPSQNNLVEVEVFGLEFLGEKLGIIRICENNVVLP